MNRFRAAPWLRPLLTLVAGALLYGGERLAAATPARLWVSVPGALLLVAGAGWSGWAAWRERGTRLAPARRWALAPQAAFLLAGAAYGAVLWLGTGPAAAHWAGPLRYAWALTAAMGAVLFGFVELALWRLRGQAAAELDAARVGRAAGAGLWLALLLGLIATLDLAGSRLAWQWDLAYFKTTEPSDATRAAVAALPEPVQVGVFFPDGNPVASQLDAYFRRLTGGTTRLTYGVWDAELEPVQAQAFQARSNGWVILKRGAQVKPLQVATRLDAARAGLRRFDTDFLTSLAEVSRDPRSVYETIGHGERMELNRPNAAADNTDRFGTFDAILRARNFRVQQLDYAKGLGSQIPADAFLVVIAGPTEPFSRAEADALRGYLKQGGRLLVFLEPGQPAPGPGGTRRAPRSADPLLAVLGEYGVHFDAVPRANDRFFARRTYTQADFGLLGTIAFETHPAVAPLRAAPNQFPVFLLGSGALKLEGAPQGFKAQATVKSMPGTWGDRNGNFRFDPPAETREDVVLAAVVAPDAAPKPGTKSAAAAQSAGPYLAVYADADLASDLLLQNRGNAMLVVAGLDWLSGQEPAGAPNLEEDQRITHVRGDEWLWFYLPVIGIPAALLGFGVWRLRRRPRVTHSAGRAA